MKTKQLKVQFKTGESQTFLAVSEWAVAKHFMFIRTVSGKTFSFDRLCIAEVWQLREGKVYKRLHLKQF